VVTPGRHDFSTEALARGDDADGREATSAGRHCGQCGRRLTPPEAVAERFGESFCSGANAEAFVHEVRATRVRPAVTWAATTADERAGAAPTGMPATRDWTTSIGRALSTG
jgi:hypothetical protein